MLDLQTIIFAIVALAAGLAVGFFVYRPNIKEREEKAAAKAKKILDEVKMIRKQNTHSASEAKKEKVVNKRRFIAQMIEPILIFCVCHLPTWLGR